MKKNKAISLVLALTLIGSTFAGCGSSSKSSSGKTSYHFVFIPKVVSPWYEDVKKGAEAAVKDYKKKGINITFDWTAPSKADVVDHTQKIESAISQKPDGIACAVLDAASDGPVIDEAMKAGVNVITFDCDAPNSKRLSFVGHDKNYEDGKALADILAKKIGEKGKVAMLIGSLGAPNHTQRSKGFADEMASKYPDIKVVAKDSENNDLEKAVTMTESILEANTDLKGLYGANSICPVAEGRAVRDAGKAGKVAIVGFDDQPETVGFLKDGTVTASLVQNVYDIGYDCIKYMVDAAQNKKIPKKFETGAYMVTKDNLNYYHQKSHK